MALVERENEILNTIKKMVETGLDFVVVGGYAVSGLARHRYSVDCDIVVFQESFEKFKTLFISAFIDTVKSVAIPVIKALPAPFMLGPVIFALNPF